MFDDTILKVFNIDLEKIIENIHDLGENILDMLAFERLVRDEQQKVIKRILNDDE